MTDDAIKILHRRYVKTSEDMTELEKIRADEMTTGKEMCELISKYLKDTKGLELTWEQIWNHSPTGELYWVYEYYERAKEFYQEGK